MSTDQATRVLCLLSAYLLPGRTNPVAVWRRYRALLAEWRALPPDQPSRYYTE